MKVDDDDGDWDVLIVGVVYGVVHVDKGVVRCSWEGHRSLRPQYAMGVHHSSSRDISALNKATIVDAAEILLAEKTPEANKDDDDFEIALQGMDVKQARWEN